MDELCLRFPYICDKIFSHLDNKSLVNCRLVSKNVKNCLDNEKILWTKMIKKYVSRLVSHRRKCNMFNQNQNHDFDISSWSKFLKQIPIYIVRDIAIGTSIIMSKYEDKKVYQSLISPQHVAAEFGLLESLQYIIENNSYCNPRNMFGYTPLHSAAKNGHIEVFQLIRENVIDKNPADSNGITPLVLAAQNGHSEICQMIIENTMGKHCQDKTFELCDLLLQNVKDRSTKLSRTL